jgi:hypothetical protein
MNLSTFWGGAVAPYQIEQSLRFNDDDSAYLSRTPGSAGNRKTWTWSGWLKKCGLASGQQTLFRVGSAPNPRAGLYFLDNTLAYFSNPTGSAQVAFYQTSALFRDASAWLHVVFALDTTQSTATDRIKIYINGTRVTAFSSSTDPNTNEEGPINTAVEHRIGKADAQYYDGYLAEVNFIDGSALDPTDFGEYDDNGVWRPIKYAGSYTGNSFYLKFDAADVDGDSSGLGNDWTANNFTTSGTGTDVMSDTPTTNWATLNPLDKFSTTIDNGNLVCTTGTSANPVLATFDCPSSGRWYWEVRPSPVNDAMIGVQNRDNVYNTGYSGSKTAYYRGSDVYVEGSKVGDFTTYTTDDIIGIGLNSDASEITFYKNGTSITTQSLTSVEGLVPLIYQASSSGTCSAEFNFGQRAFAYTPPTGFKALNTSNLPAPDIADGSEYFDTLTWTGDSSGATRTFSGLAFQPDLVWAKGRNQAISHQLTDAVRGAGATSLRSDDTRVEGADGTASGYLSAFTSDGFTSTSSSTNVYYNTNTYTYVSWNWLAGGSGSSNTDGTATNTVTVSASPTAGFSIVTYSGQSTNFTWGHGLGVPPSMVIIKGRTNTAGWSVYHSALGATKRLALNTTDAAETMSYFQNTEPTSTVFSVTTNGGTGANGVDYVAYCFAEVEGYSKFGSYTGNGSTDGPFVYCGFSVQWLLYKRTNDTEDWVILDNARDTYNPADAGLRPNWNYAEFSNSEIPVDFTSNGFKLRATDRKSNGSGSTYIFMAFAENPFGGSGVSPATAR